MSNGDDIRVPLPDLPFGGGRTGNPRSSRNPPRQGQVPRVAPIRGGLPVPILPTFPELPPQPTTQPVRLPTGPAANDPVFSQASKILRAGNVIVGIAIILDQLIRKAQDLEIEEEFREREAVFELEKRRRALEREPIEIVITEPREDPGPDPIEFPLPDVSPLPEQPVITPAPVEIPGVQIPTSAPTTPSEIELPGPTTPTAPRPATVPLPGPATVPGIGSQPGVFTPTPTPTPTPIGVPSSLPGIFPIPFPIGRPTTFRVGDPLTPVRPEVVPSGDIGSFADVTPFPQPLPQQQPARRCEPCPQEEPPSLRDQCFKGLYREGPFTDDVDFTEWAEIDCFTGVEL